MTAENFGNKGEYSSFNVTVAKDAAADLTLPLGRAPKSIDPRILTQPTRAAAAQAPQRVSTSPNPESVPMARTASPGSVPVHCASYAEHDNDVLVHNAERMDYE